MNSCNCLFFYPRLLLVAKSFLHWLLLLGCSWIVSMNLAYLPCLSKFCNVRPTLPSLMSIFCILLDASLRASPKLSALFEVHLFIPKSDLPLFHPFILLDVWRRDGIFVGKLETRFKWSLIFFILERNWVARMDVCFRCFSGFVRFGFGYYF